jgi:TatD DNase family protein
MNLPQTGDYIDIHVHDGRPAGGIFIIESLMAHEEKKSEQIPGVAYTFGIHPWFLDENNYNLQIASVEKAIINTDIIAVGEAGFDKLRGPSYELQRLAFEKQVILSEENRKPLIIHCVKAWDELLSVQKELKPQMSWMIHGFRGGVKLAEQLISKGMYLSIWFDFVLKPESAELLKSLPIDKLFLETDGADVDIRDIYKKVAGDLNISIDKLKSGIYTNFRQFFDLSAPGFLQ